MVPEKKKEQTNKQKGKRSHHYGKMTGSDLAIESPQIQRRVQMFVISLVSISLSTIAYCFCQMQPMLAIMWKLEVRIGFHGAKLLDPSGLKPMCLKKTETNQNKAKQSKKKKTGIVHQNRGEKVPIPVSAFCLSDLVTI